MPGHSRGGPHSRRWEGIPAPVILLGRPGPPPRQVPGSFPRRGGQMPPPAPPQAGSGGPDGWIGDGIARIYPQARQTVKGPVFGVSGGHGWPGSRARPPLSEACRSPGNRQGESIPEPTKDGLPVRVPLDRCAWVGDNGQPAGDQESAKPGETEPQAARELQ